MRAKNFFYVCAGIFLLALSYHFGATSAGAQAPGNPVVSGDQWVVFSANGDYFVRDGIGLSGVTYSAAGNVFSGGPTPATKETWGGLKARYR